MLFFRIKFEYTTIGQGMCNSLSMTKNKTNKHEYVPSVFIVAIFISFLLPSIHTGIAFKWLLFWAYAPYSFIHRKCTHCWCVGMIFPLFAWINKLSHSFLLITVQILRLRSTYIDWWLMYIDVDYRSVYYALNSFSLSSSFSSAIYLKISTAYSIYPCVWILLCGCNYCHCRCYCNLYYCFFHETFGIKCQA